MSFPYMVQQYSITWYAKQICSTLSEIDNEMPSTWLRLTACSRSESYAVNSTPRRT